MAFRCVLFDVDGTLVDSNDAHARAWLDAFREFGFQVPYQRARRLVGMGGDKLIPAAVGLSKDEPRGKALAERRAAIFRERYLKQVRPFPGVRELVDRLRGEGLKVAVATSAQPDELRPLLRIARLEELLGESASAEDADRSKPDPDIVAAALRQARCPAAESVMVGDTPYDIEAARGAGVPTIALRSGGWDDEGLAGALAIYEDAADLLEHLEVSPLAAAAERARP